MFEIDVTAKYMDMHPPWMRIASDCFSACYLNARIKEIRLGSNKEKDLGLKGNVTQNLAIAK